MLIQKCTRYHLNMIRYIKNFKCLKNLKTVYPYIKRGNISG